MKFPLFEKILTSLQGLAIGVAIYVIVGDISYRAKQDPVKQQYPRWSIVAVSSNKFSFIDYADEIRGGMPLFSTLEDARRERDRVKAWYESYEASKTSTWKVVDP